MRMYKFILSLFFGLITLAIAMHILIDYILARFKPKGEDLLFILFVWTIPLGMTLLMLYKYRKLSKDIKEGRKQIIVARIEEVGCDSYTPTRRGTKIGGSSVYFNPYPQPATRYTHWVRFNGMKIIPRAWVGNKGDMAELYIGPHSKRILSDLIKRSDALPTESE